MREYLTLLSQKSPTKSVEKSFIATCFAVSSINKKNLRYLLLTFNLCFFFHFALSPFMRVILFQWFSSYKSIGQSFKHFKLRSPLFVREKPDEFLSAVGWLTWWLARHTKKDVKVIDVGVVVQLYFIAISRLFPKHRLFPYVANVSILKGAQEEEACRICCLFSNHKKIYKRTQSSAISIKKVKKNVNHRDDEVGWVSAYARKRKTPIHKQLEDISSNHTHAHTHTARVRTDRAFVLIVVRPECNKLFSKLKMKNMQRKTNRKFREKHETDSQLWLLLSHHSMTTCEFISIL